ncbi:glycosyltransferase family 4 protein [Magnetospirillum sulfuroxidans]|uniref:Glycosyltransferase family 4 protein n=1 Tax=Magnetospirillum sulfuroxidans TaxID=611300 RepID=A0ABS5IH19_9PROT|nr:glycosyltransferase family 4 protein [Magnetospirillum sulfuroxidans]MBR9973697.1 glycosyltransferase family 4 protein [Magnetospirillum sulfuroxidans]
MAQRTLIITLPPFEGGVPAKTRLLAQELAARGHHITIAYYAPLSSHRHLSPSPWSLRHPGVEAGRCFDAEFDAVAVGCRWAELEFPYYLPSPRWQALIDAHDRHVAVGGTVLVSNPLRTAKVPHLVWCASDMLGDRLDRRLAMTWPRRLIDHAVIGPVQAAMERRILAGTGRIVTVGHHALGMFRRLGFAMAGSGIMPIPTDPDLYRPAATEAEAGIIGFAGRPNDPRKNLGLLIRAIVIAHGRDPRIRLRLTGQPDKSTAAMIRSLGAQALVQWQGVLPRQDLPGFYAGLDVFALPSAQEGFGIVGIEAMACGVPVVSTRCGGPQDYVCDGETGFLVDSTAQAMAEALLRLVIDRALHHRMGHAARNVAKTRYSPACFRKALDENWQAVWGEHP